MPTARRNKKCSKQHRSGLRINPQPDQKMTDRVVAVCVVSIRKGDLYILQYCSLVFIKVRI